MDEYYREIDKVKVIKDFPGFDKGDVLVRYYDDTFILQPANGEQYPTTRSWRLDELEILSNIDKYFEDITEYVVKSPEQIEKAIEKIKDSIESEDSDYEAVLVWNNLIYCLEWVLGKREYLTPEQMTDNEKVQEDNEG